MNTDCAARHGPPGAQDPVARHAAEIDVGMVPFQALVYRPDEDRYEELARVGEGRRTASDSGTQAREDYLSAGLPRPGWFTRPEVAAILAESYRPRHQQGVCTWFTGLPGAGKSTIADVLVEVLMERGRQVTLLDGDVVRTHLSKGQGFIRPGKDLGGDHPPAAPVAP